MHCFAITLRAVSVGNQDMSRPQRQVIQLWLATENFRNFGEICTLLKEIGRKISRRDSKC